MKYAIKHFEFQWPVLGLTSCNLLRPAGRLPEFAALLFQWPVLGLTSCNLRQYQRSASSKYAWFQWPVLGLTSCNCKHLDVAEYGTVQAVFQWPVLGLTSCNWNPAIR